MPERRVSARLRHPTPESTTAGTGWTFRATECDIADHVNNAAYWLPLEEELLAGDDPDRLDVEIEYRTPAQPGAKRVLANGRYRWIVGDDAELHASIRVGRPTATDAGSARASAATLGSDVVAQAVGIPAPGGPEVLEVIDRPVREPGEGEVRIAVGAAAVNPPTSACARSGADGIDPPWTPGMDAAGTIESVGPGVDRLAAGDQVMAAVSPRRPEGGAQCALLVVAGRVGRPHSREGDGGGRPRRCP